MFRVKEKFTILIPTKNRLEELKHTLFKLESILVREDTICIICDDGSTEGTFDYVTKHFPKIEIFRNEESKGIHYVRNRLLNKVKTPFAISIDDDAHFITLGIFEIIENYFSENEKAGILSFRAYWNKNEPSLTIINEKSTIVKGFGAVGFAIRMSAWDSIPNFPEWFIFYGEEDFAAFQLFKKGWEVHYVPEILVHHRVDLKARKNEKDYRLRLRRSLRSGWYLYFMFYPLKVIPRRLAYTLWIQIKNKIFKGDRKAALAIVQAMCDVMLNLPRLLNNANRLTTKEFKAYSKLPDTKLYWIPEED
ncbi:MAG: glycosyl transferase [Bacteroidetes bacterium HGW-Bacteroidetes-3]|jgi:GT2 family glycosyltransferase|nr:MAG: glycosyl transferase [Bacteroidetes bacterium HGW-Bacteroidetes-3]